MKGAIIDRPPTRFHHRTRRAYGLLPPALPVGELSAQLTERVTPAAPTVMPPGMIYYHTINRGNPLNNQIRGISPTNPKRFNYFAAGRALAKSGRLDNTIVCLGSTMPICDQISNERDINLGQKKPVTSIFGCWGDSYEKNILFCPCCMSFSYILHISRCILRYGHLWVLCRSGNNCVGFKR